MSRDSVLSTQYSVLSTRLRAPAIIWGPATAVAAAMLLPLFYLGVRAAGAGEDALPLLLRPRTGELLLNTIGLTLTVTAATTLLAVPLAWLLVRSDLPGRHVWTVALSLPLVVPTYVSALAFVAALGPRGLLQQTLAAPLGIQRLPDIYGFPGAALVLTLTTYPYVLLTVRAAIQRLDPALWEAGRSLGCSPPELIRRITLPQLAPAIAAGALLVALYTLSDFGAVSLLQYDSFTLAIYTQYRASFDRQLAALFGLVLVALTLLVLILEGWVRSGARYHRSTPGAAREQRRVRLGRWKGALALAYCALVAALALVLPVGVLAYWLLQGLGQGNAFALVWEPALHSLQGSALAAVAAVAGALPLALLAVRYPGPFGALLERAAYAGFALPGIVIALALVFFAANYVQPLYQTLALLVFAYVVRFLPEALGAVRASLLQINPHLEEAARSLGRSLPATIWAVTLPLLRPGLVAGAALVFLTAMKELPATLLLAPTGFKTLATAIWGAAGEGLYAQAAAPALLLVAVSALALSLITSERGGGLA
jgi:iron(III) transport system permease protein